MSLAVVIFDRDGKLCDQLAVEPYEHFKLMRQLDEHKLPMLLRLSNYFEDAVYEPEELPQLIEEIKAVLKATAAGDPLVPILKSFRRIAQSAQRRDTAINVVGDYAYP